MLQFCQVRLQCQTATEPTKLPERNRRAPLLTRRTYRGQGIHSPKRTAHSAASHEHHPKCDVRHREV